MKLKTEAHRVDVRLTVRSGKRKELPSRMYVGGMANLEVGQQLPEVNIRAFSGTSIFAKQRTY